MLSLFCVIVALHLKRGFIKNIDSIIIKYNALSCTVADQSIENPENVISIGTIPRFWNLFLNPRICCDLDIYCGKNFRMIFILHKSNTLKYMENKVFSVRLPSFQHDITDKICCFQIVWVCVMCVFVCVLFHRGIFRSQNWTNSAWSISTN